MTELSSAEALGYAKDHASKAWYLFARERNFKVFIPGWRPGAAPDGSPTLSVEVVGPGAAHALRLFTADCFVVLGGPGDQRPGFDYSTPGRVSCVWRKYGVWIELWHRDTVAPAPDPKPAPVPARPFVRRVLSRPGGRLPFTRNRSKETPTR